MFNFDKSDVQRIAVSSMGALAVSAATIFGTVAPARAAAPTPTTVADWQHQVERQLDSTEGTPAMTDQSKVRSVTMAARFTADGDYAGTELARSSGSKAVDAHALHVARQVAYPVLPASYRGQPQTVTVRLYYGANDAVIAKARKAEAAQYAQNNAGPAGIQIAAR